MKDPSLNRRRRNKLKLVVSFNGKFLCRSPAGKLRYVGGEAHILSVDRGITYEKLCSRIYDLLVRANGVVRPFVLTYHLKGEKEEAHMGLIESDDDVRWVIDEFELLEFEGKSTRLWVFVCNDYSDCKDSDLNVNCGVLGGGFSGFYGNDNGFLKNGRVDLGGENGVEGKITVTHWSKHDRGKKFVDEPLRKMMLKKHFLAKQRDRIRSLHDSPRKIDEESIMKNGNYDDDDDPFLGVASGPRSCIELNNPKFGAGSYEYRVNLLDYEYKKGHFVGRKSCKELSTLPASKSSPLNPKDGNMMVGLNGSMGGLMGQAHVYSGYANASRLGDSCHLSPRQQPQNSSLVSTKSPSFSSKSNTGGNDAVLFSNVNRENLVPSDVSHHMERNRFPLLPCCNQIVRQDYPKSCLNSCVVLNGETQAGTGYQCFSPSDIRNQKTSANHIRNSSNANGMNNKFRLNRSPWEGRFYHDRLLIPNFISEQGATIVRKYQERIHDEHSGNSMCPINSVKFASPSKRIVYNQIDPLTSQSSSDINDDVLTANQGDVINSTHVHDGKCFFNIAEKRCNDKFSDKEAVCEPFNNYKHNILHDGASTTPQSLYLSPSYRSGTSEALQKPQSKHLDSVDDKHFSSEPQVQKSSETICHSSPRSHKIEKDADRKGDIQLDENNGTNNCQNTNGVVPARIAALCTHLATGELQKIKNDDLEYMKELGSGTYGTVYYGRWKGSDVAIKRIKPSCFTDGAAEEDRLVADFWKEAHILGQLHHPNIVALYGVVTDGPLNNLATVTEYMVNGCLAQVLRRKDRTIDRRKRLIIAMDAAFGMEYLHGKKIVHFDLKSHNFLVNMRDPQRPVCKIGDLGLSKIKQRTLVSGGLRGTIPWMAPELLNGNEMVTEKVDVYSFGIVMWELLTCEEPYTNLKAEEIIAGIIRGILRPEIPNWCNPAWRSLMERCWSSDPEARPSFSEISNELRAMAAAMKIR